MRRGGASYAFCATGGGLVSVARPAVAHRSRRQPRCCPRLVRAALIVVDLTAAVEGGQAARSFAERVHVDRAAARQSSAGHRAAFLLYLSDAPHVDARHAASVAELPEPDAISASGGLYQRGYETPDPYLNSQLWKDWDPKPAQWVISKFFSDALVERKTDSSEGGALEIVVDLKRSEDSALELHQSLSKKLSEMGIPGEVNMRYGGAAPSCLVVKPVAADQGVVVEFCANMLRLEGPASVCVFGRESFVDPFVRSHENSVGIVASDVLDEDHGKPSERCDRVFLSKHTGVAALLEGVVHHAVF